MAYTIIEAYTEDQEELDFVVRSLDSSGFKAVLSSVGNNGLRAIALYADCTYQVLYRENYESFIDLLGRSQECNIRSFVKQACYYKRMKQRLTTDANGVTIDQDERLKQLDLFKP